MEIQQFLDRVFQRMQKTPVTAWQFQHWSFQGRPTDEGVGLLPVPGVDPARLVARVMDVDHYRGNVEHVAECRSIPDPEYKMPGKVRFYQRVEVPVIGSVHHELVLVDAGVISGYHVAYWYMLEAQTQALPHRGAARSQYNQGMWLAAPGVVGYALSSAPRRDDVNFLQWKALTAGADLAAATVIRKNIEGMVRWASRP